MISGLVQSDENWGAKVKRKYLITNIVGEFPIIG
jgi:hypothetical protein